MGPRGVKMDDGGLGGALSNTALCASRPLLSRADRSCIVHGLPLRAPTMRRRPLPRQLVAGVVLVAVVVVVVVEEAVAVVVVVGVVVVLVAVVRVVVVVVAAWVWVRLGLGLTFSLSFWFSFAFFLTFAFCLSFLLWAVACWGYHSGHRHRHGCGHWTGGG